MTIPLNIFGDNISVPPNVLPVCLPGYVDIGLIPEGARDIRIEEVAEAGNFLALRSDDPEKYFLNGGWTIQWNGDYKVAGTIFTYERTGHLENLTSPGPTMEPVWIQVGEAHVYTQTPALTHTQAIVKLVKLRTIKHIW